MDANSKFHEFNKLPRGIKQMILYFSVESFKSAKNKIKRSGTLRLVNKEFKNYIDSSFMLRDIQAQRMQMYDTYQEEKKRNVVQKQDILNSNESMSVEHCLFKMNRVLYLGFSFL